MRITYRADIVLTPTPLYKGIGATGTEAEMAEGKVCVLFLPQPSLFSAILVL